MSCSARLPVYVLLIGAFLTAGRPWWVPGLTMFGLYAVGLVVAPLVALALKRTLLRGATPVFVMEMPTYKVPSLRTVLRRMADAAGAFLRRAGTLILASMVIVWALLYCPWWDGAGRRYEDRIAAAGADSDAAKALQAEWKRDSLLGRLGRAIEPAVRPLGWDWRVGVAALASFPAREVMVGTLGIVYAQGDVDAGVIGEADWEEVGDTGLGQALRTAVWPDGRPVFTIPAVLSLLVFFALCCQCASTLAVIRRETGTWRWPAFTFAYMTALAYVAALVVYQVGSRIA
jgi:ferrous iron transport protein B